MAEWLKAADCKSVLVRVRRFEPYSAHHSNMQNGKLCRYAIFDYIVLFFANLPIGTFAYLISGSSSFGRAVAFQASGGRFEPGLPLSFCLRWQNGLSRRSSGVEHFLGREGVVSSILTDGS